jgi:hypothetical protein
MRLELDRICLDDTGGNPERLAGAIHDQLGAAEGAVPVYDIARALDIDDIREVPLKSFESALITCPEKDRGAIVVNSRSSRRRRRYTVGHELGHFLNPWHEPTTLTGFQCTRADMLVSFGTNVHLKQEAEANCFAIELLAPRRRLNRYLAGSADLGRALALATDFDISKEAAVRRYVALHDETLAVVFSRADSVRYIDRGQEFPALGFWKGDRLPALSDIETEWQELDPRDWLKRTARVGLSAQILRQADDHAIIVLRAESGEAEDDGEGDVDEELGFGPRR